MQPTGFTEIHTGTMTPHGLSLQLTDLSPSPSAMPVTDLHRHIVPEGQELSYVLRLAMHHEPLADHLSGRLLRQPPPG